MSRLAPWGNSAAAFSPSYLILSLIPAVLFAFSVRAQTPPGLQGVWDSNRYIGLDEVEPGMEAYCLTVYGTQGIERFGLEVIDVVRDVEPGRDAILVKGIDERFLHTGPVAGCSGSPVYIDGRLAGALAFAWTSAKDPLYGTTPIAEMLMVGEGKGPLAAQSGGAIARTSVFDFSRPLDFSALDRQRSAAQKRSSAALSRLPCPVLVSGVGSQAVEQLRNYLSPLGLEVYAGAGATGTNDNAGDLAPGGCLMLPLVSGDISLSVTGTVTEVRGEKIYGFGHSFLGYGGVDLPMAGGRVHTVVSSLVRSFKLTSPGPIIGALRRDEAAAIYGHLGAKPALIPLRITVDRYNDPEVRTYDCSVASNDRLTAGLVRSAIAGAAARQGDFPPEHTVEYAMDLNLQNGWEISFENISTDMMLSEVVTEYTGTIEMLMNHPFKKVPIESISTRLRITPESETAHIWAMKLSDTTVKPGDSVKVDVTLEGMRSQMRHHDFTLEIPDHVEPGKYNLTVCGSYGYEQFVRKKVPYRYLAHNMSSLVAALNEMLNIDRARLYCMLELPDDGLTIERSELPDLPKTRAMVLQSNTRTLRTQPYPHWIQKSVDIDSVVIDKQTVQINVEK